MIRQTESPTKCSLLLAKRIHCSSGDKSDEDQGQDLGTIIKEEKPKLEKPPLYKVVLINDDYTPMDFVVEILRVFFGMNIEKATPVSYTHLTLPTKA